MLPGDLIPLSGPQSLCWNWFNCVMTFSERERPCLFELISCALLSWSLFLNCTQGGFSHCYSSSPLPLKQTSFNIWFTADKRQGMFEPLKTEEKKILSFCVLFWIVCEYACVFCDCMFIVCLFSCLRRLNSWIPVLCVVCCL